MDVMVQFSVFLTSKPGQLAKICRELGKAKINIKAMTMMDAQEHGVLRLIASDPSKARPVLHAMNFPVTETEVLAVTMPNKPGAVADILEKLSANHVHINYVYCTTGAAGGKTVGVFKINELKKAMKILDARKNTNRDMKAKLRRPPATRG